MAPGAVVSEVARRNGMLTLRQDGMAKVASGVTSIDEILRVVV
jgi:type II secretory ATPase GspE/PulE/Tfp pilus assembly ATPase PilB-like protein